MSRPVARILLFLLVAIAIAIVFIPVWVIMPFKAQTARGVAISYTLKSWSPIVTLLAAILAIALIGYLWRGSRRLGRTAMVLALIPLFIAAWFARQNHFEWMFNPLPNPNYQPVASADFVGDRDMVMSVTINGESAAYPVRQMGYHHIVSDVVGGVPITATY